MCHPGHGGTKFVWKNAVPNEPCQGGSALVKKKDHIEIHPLEAAASMNVN